MPEGKKAKRFDERYIMGHLCVVFFKGWPVYQAALLTVNAHSHTYTQSHSPPKPIIQLLSAEARTKHPEGG